MKTHNKAPKFAGCAGGTAKELRSLAAPGLIVIGIRGYGRYRDTYFHEFRIDSDLFLIIYGFHKAIKIVSGSI